MGYRKPVGPPTYTAPPPSAAAHVVTRTAAGIGLASIALAFPVVGPLLLALFGVPVAFADARRARRRREIYARAEAAYLDNPGRGTAVAQVDVTPLHRVI